MRRVPGPRLGAVHALAVAGFGLVVVVGVVSAAAQPTPSDASVPPGGPGTTSASPEEQVIAVRAPPLVEPRVLGTCDASLPRGSTVRFGLAHLNDLQARYSDLLDGKSRYAYIAGYLKRLRAGQPTLVLDAGDDYEKGALAELRTMGETTRQMIQALPIDVRTIGNHDFAYGEIAVLRDVRLSGHPVLAANVRHVGLPASQQPFRAFTRIDVGCVKVGVIGLVTQNFGADDKPTSLPYDGVFAQDDHYQAILEREAKAHRAEVDVLIALTHLGYADDIALAHRGGRLVDFIVGAHTEDLLKEPLVVAHPQEKTRTWIVQAGHFGETLGHGEVVVNLKDHKVGFEKYKIVTVDASLPVDEDVAALAARLEATAVPDAHAAIGKVEVPVRTGRPLAELVWRAASTTWNVDTLVIGKDLFWAGLPRGDLSLQRLYDAVLVQRQPAGTPGFSSIWVQEVTGDDLTLLLRNVRAGGTYEAFGLTSGDPKKRYRLALDKRAATYPRALFGVAAMGARASTRPPPALAGELIDALEAYTRSRSARGLPLDGALK